MIKLNKYSGWITNSVLRPDDAEFKIGDKITYKPYKEENPLVVVGYTYSFQKELLYMLATHKDRGVVTQTTGRSIMESKDYVPEER